MWKSLHLHLFCQPNLVELNVVRDLDNYIYQKQNVLHLAEIRLDKLDKRISWAALFSAAAAAAAALFYCFRIVWIKLFYSIAFILGVLINSNNKCWGGAKLSK